MVVFELFLLKSGRILGVVEDFLYFIYEVIAKSNAGLNDYIFYRVPG